MFENMKYKIQNKILPIALISFLILLAYSIISGDKVYYYDSGLYWGLSRVFAIDGTFSFENFPSTFRGYLYPFMMYIFSYLDIIVNKPGIGFMVFNSFMGSLAITSIYLIFGKIDNTKRILIGTVFSSILLIYFFKDLILYPLSDIPAFAMFACACYLFKRYLENDKVYLCIIAGALMQGAYNTRTIYLYPAIVLVIYILFDLIIINKKQVKNIIIFFTCLSIGFTVVALPQMIINKKHSGIYSPMVLTENYSDGSQNLFLMQLNWGITNSKYETYVGEEGHYSSPGVRFTDKTGEKIILLEGKLPESIGEWFKLVLKYPLDFIGIFVRHIVTYLTPVYSEAYITNLNTDKTIIITLNILLFFVSGLNLFNNRIKRNNGKCDITVTTHKYIWLILLLMPCLFIIPGAPEVRFFIALHTMLYVYLCFYVDFKYCFEVFKLNPMKYLISFIFIFAIWVTIIGGILSSLADPTYIFTIR